LSSIRGDKRINLGKFIIANIKIKGKNYEILVDPDNAWEIKKAIRKFEKEKSKTLNKTYNVTVDDVLAISPVPVDEVIEGYVVFENLRRGEKVSEDEIEKIFGTTDIRHVTAYILLHGNLQLTKEQRDKFIQEKKKKLINILTKNCINPQTKKPHPPGRIERALQEARIHIDPFNPVEDQVADIVKSLKSIIPIKMERTTLSIVIPPEFTGKSYNLINTMGVITKEEWKNNGALECTIEIPAGIQPEFLDKLNKITHGRASAKIIETKSL